MPVPGNRWLRGYSDAGQEPAPGVYGGYEGAPVLGGPAARRSVMPAPATQPRLSPPRRRHGPANALRVTGLTDAYAPMNGEYSLQDPGHFVQTGGPGTLLHHNGRWRLCFPSGTTPSNGWLASSGSLLGQWQRDPTAGDAIVGAYPHIVATDTRDPTASTAGYQPTRAPSPSPFSPDAGGYSQQRPGTMSLPAVPDDSPLFLRPSEMVDYTSFQQSAPPVSRTTTQRFLIPPTPAHEPRDPVDHLSPTDSDAAAVAELAALRGQLKEARQKEDEQRKADSDKASVLQQLEVIRQDSNKQRRDFEKTCDDMRRDAAETEAQLGHSKSRLQIVEQDLRETKNKLDRTSALLREAAAEAERAYLELEAEKQSHRKTAAGAEIAIDEYRMLVADADVMAAQAKYDLVAAQQAGGRSALAADEAAAAQRLLLWAKAPAHEFLGASLRAAQSERTAHEATTRELALMAQENQFLAKERAALEAELQAERSSQMKTANGADHLAKELEDWRNEVKDTMRAEEVQMGKKLRRAQDAEEQAMRVIDLLKEQMEQIKVQMEAAENRALAAENERSGLIAEMREQLGATQKSATSEARVREALLADLQEARRKSSDSTLLQKENLAGRIELLAVTAGLSAQLENALQDPAQLSNRVDEITGHLASKMRETNSQLQEGKDRADHLLQVHQQQKSDLDALRQEASQLQRENTRLAEENHRLSEVNDFIEIANEQRARAEELGMALEKAHDQIERLEENEAAQAQQLGALSGLSAQLGEAQREAGHAREEWRDEMRKREAAEGEVRKYDAELRRREAEVRRLEDQLRRAEVDDSTVRDLTQKINRFEDGAEAARQFERRAANDKAALSGHIGDLENELASQKAANAKLKNRLADLEDDRSKAELQLVAERLDRETHTEWRNDWEAQHARESRDWRDKERRERERSEDRARDLEDRLREEQARKHGPTQHSQAPSSRGGGGDARKAFESPAPPASGRPPLSIRLQLPGTGGSLEIKQLSPTRSHSGPAAAAAAAANPAAGFAAGFAPNAASNRRRLGTRVDADIWSSAPKNSAAPAGPPSAGQSVYTPRTSVLF
ncbi:hypothetical protein DIPPA_15897 [Diplonema papillatum]|nr:hypothetical protein DIPPA_15897 [Diplonema papillatum]